METASEAIKPPIPLRERLWDAVVMLLFFEGSQGMTLLHLPRVFLSDAVLRGHSWIGVYEGHLWELGFALGFIGIAGKGRYSSWGFNLNLSGLSLRILWRYCVVFLAIAIAWNVIPPLLHHELDLGNFGPPTPLNIAGWLSFEWIFVGIAEEAMFRGVIQTYLARTWTRVWRVRGIDVPAAGIVTTVLFCLAHIDPLHPRIYWSQQLFAFCLGIYYSLVYYRTRSLLGPILSHNASDGMIVTALYLVYIKLH